MRQSSNLNADGTVGFRRMRLYTSGEAKNTPAIKVSRLQRLLRTNRPSICVVRGEGIGDVITTTPTIYALRQMFEHCSMTYATNTKYLDGALVKVLQHNPDIDTVIDRENINESDYDLVVNLHCPCISYEKHENAPISRIDLFAQHTGVRLEDPTPRYFIQQSEIDSGAEYLAPVLHDKLVLVQPFPSTERRSWDHSKLRQTLVELSKHGYRSIIVTHSHGWKTDVMWENIPGAIALHDADIRTIASILVHCDLVLCPDSAILHLAGALGVPGVCLFGPTHPDARVNHYPNIIPIWEGKNMRPCPCWYGACPIGNACWASLTVERVVETCLKKISQSNRVNLKQLVQLNQYKVRAEII